MYKLCLKLLKVYFLAQDKGQLNSEWIYEVIVSPKMQTENYKDFCPTKQTRIIAKKLPTLTKKSIKKRYDPCLYGRVEIFCLHFGKNWLQWMNNIILNFSYVSGNVSKRRVSFSKRSLQDLHQNFMMLMKVCSCFCSPKYINNFYPDRVWVLLIFEWMGQLGIKVNQTVQTF